MVEISKSGSGEGVGWVTGRGYATSCEDTTEVKRTERFSSVWSDCLGSAIEAIDLEPLGVSQVGIVVSISVVFENQGCLAFIQSFLLQSRHKQSLNLRQGLSRSFF